MQFILTGFTQVLGFRVFGFERIGEGGIRTPFTVRADLALIRKFSIQVQELPLLCRNLLERADSGETARALTFTEEAMDLYAKDRKAARDAAVQRRKPPRRPPSENVGSAWRVPQPQ